MLENLKNLFKDFDFRLPVSLNDITPDFLTVVLCLIALIAIIISVAVLSKKKKERLAELERADKEKPEVPNPPTADVKPALKQAEVPNKRKAAPEPAAKAESQKPKETPIRSDISYTDSFAPVKTPHAAPRKPKSAAERFAVNHNRPPVAAEKPPEPNALKVENGLVIITPEQKNQLEKAYSAALRKCAMNGTSKELEKLLDAKRMLHMDKIPQKEFEGLMALLFPKQ